VKEHRERDGYLDDPQSFIDIFLQEIDKHRSEFETIFTGMYFANMNHLNAFSIIQ